MMPPAPARFSTTMVWPRSSPSFFCMTRATVSVPPPGAKPTTRVIGRPGYPWADAFATMASAAASATMIFMLLLLFSFAAPSVARLLSLKRGLALLHEGSAASDVILAFEAGLDQRRACLRVERRARFQELANDALGGADGERRVLRNQRAILEDERFEVRDRRHAVHEAHRFRFCGAEMSPGDEYLARVRRADDVDQVLQRGGAIAQAEPRCRNAELRVLRGDPQVAAEREVDPRAQAIAADHGDQHLVAAL